MIALGLGHVIEREFDELAAQLIAKLETVLRTSELRKVPIEAAAAGRVRKILRHWESGCSLTGHDNQAALF